MNIALWICQWSLAGVFAFSGLVKGTQSKQRIIALAPTGVEYLPLSAIRFVAVAERAGALGVVAPGWSGIAPAFTPAAAVGLGAIMPLTAATHIKLNEPRNAAANMVLFAVCAFVAVGRFADLMH